MFLLAQFIATLKRNQLVKSLTLNQANIIPVSEEMFSASEITLLQKHVLALHI